MQKFLTSSQVRSLFSGVKAEAPLLIGVFPFGMIYGTLAMNAGLEKRVAQAMSAIVFAGSSQFIATRLIGSATPAIIIVLTIAVVNLRHALYSASISPYLQKLSPAWKALLAYLLTDEAYAVTITHFQNRGAEQDRHWFFLGAGFALWATWQAGTAAGILLGTVMPASWSLDFTLALTFIALVVPTLKDRAAIAAAVAAGLTAVVSYSLPYSLWIILAAIAGIGAGMLVEGRK